MKTDNLAKWTRAELAAEVRRLRRRVQQLEAGPAAPAGPYDRAANFPSLFTPPRGPTLGRPLAFSHFGGIKLLAEFFGTSTATPGPPLWVCRHCHITIGEWNPALEPAPLFCVRCREPLTIHGQQISPDGAISVSYEPIIESPKSRVPLRIDGPTKSED